MRISRDDLTAAAASGLLSEQQAADLWATLEAQASTRPRFDAPHVAYYFGALIVIGAMGWFMTKGWDTFGGFEIFVIAVAYAAIFVLAGRTLWDQYGLRIPGGILFTVAVAMTPLAIYGLERATGYWPQSDPGSYREFHEWIRGGWFLMELGTIVAGLVAMRFRRFPFLTAPIAFSLWYMSMDLTPLIYGSRISEYAREWVSLWFGLAMLLATYLVDLRRSGGEDFAFWGYLFGLMAFWGGLSAMDSPSELSKFFYCLINVGLVACSLLLRRRAFLIFGALGIFGYLGHLAYRVFEDSLIFPFAMSAMGILVIYAGVQYQKNQHRIDAFVQEHLPVGLKRLVPAQARN
jgi:hypothetical protein